MRKQREVNVKLLKVKGSYVKFRSHLSIIKHLNKFIVLNTNVGWKQHGYRRLFNTFISRTNKGHSDEMSKRTTVVIHNNHMEHWGPFGPSWTWLDSLEIVMRYLIYFFRGFKGPRHPSKHIKNVLGSSDKGFSVILK